MKILFWEISLRVRLTDRVRTWCQNTRIAKWLKARSDADFQRIFWEGQWPPKGSHREFGFTTKAHPRQGVSQDFELVAIVEKMLKESSKCDRCGHQMEQ